MWKYYNGGIENCGNSFGFFKVKLLGFGYEGVSSKYYSVDG